MDQLEILGEQEPPAFGLDPAVDRDEDAAVEDQAGGVAAE